MDKYVFTEEEIEYIMDMVFPDVRAKPYRDTWDSLPYPYNPGIHCFNQRNIL